MEKTTTHYGTYYFEFENLIGIRATRIFSYLRSISLKKENSCYVEQKNIWEVTKVPPQSQPKATKILEKWKLLEVIRGKRNNIDRYKFYEINIQLFLHSRNVYAQHVEDGSMIYFKKYGVTNEPKNERMFDYLTEGMETKFDIELIKKRTKTFVYPTEENQHHGYAFDPTGEGGQDPHSSIGPYITKKDKNILKTQNVLHSVGTDAQERPKLNRRKDVIKPNIRSQFKNVPLSKPQVNNPRRSVVDNYYNSRPFFQVMKLWNSLPNLKKISTLKEEKQNKTLDNSVLAVKALLSGTLFEKGMIDINGRKQFVSLPNNFDPSSEKIDLHWLLEKIQTLQDIILDQQAAPSNKTPLTQMSLFDFILGKFVKQERFTSVLFQFCCGQKKTIFVDENPMATKVMLEYFRLYEIMDRDLTAREIHSLAITGSRIIADRLNYFKQNKIEKTKGDLKRIDIDGLVSNFYVAIANQWKGTLRDKSPQYIASEHAWNIYLDRPRS